MDFPSSNTMNGRSVLVVGSIASITLLGRLIVSVPPKEDPKVVKSIDKVKLEGKMVRLFNRPPSMVYGIGITWLPIVRLNVFVGERGGADGEGLDDDEEDEEVVPVG